MAAVAGVLRPRLGGKRGDEPAPRGHGADRLPHQQLLVGGLQRGRMGGGDLLLAVAELGVVLLERDPLRLERRRQLVDVVLRRRSSRSSRSTAHESTGTYSPSTARGQRELVLERGAELQPALGQPALHALEKRALARRGRRAVEPTWSVSTRADVRGVGQDPECLEVGHQPHLADRRPCRPPAEADRASSSPAWPP